MWFNACSRRVKCLTAAEVICLFEPKKNISGNKNARNFGRDAVQLLSGVKRRKRTQTGTRYLTRYSSKNKTTTKKREIQNIFTRVEFSKQESSIDAPRLERPTSVTERPATAAVGQQNLIYFLYPQLNHEHGSISDLDKRRSTSVFIKVMNHDVESFVYGTKLLKKKLAGSDK